MRPPPPATGWPTTPTREDHPIRPQYPYALSKYQGEQAAFHWHNVYRLPVSSIRIFNAYGIRSRTSGAYGAVFGVFLRQKLAGKPFTVVGDGTQRRDFVYASDLATAFLAAAESPIRGECGTSAPAIRRPSIAWSSCSTGPTVHDPQAAGRARRHLGRHLPHPGRPRLAPEDQLRGRRVAYPRQYRLLARGAAVGSRFDRQARPRPGSRC